MGCWLQGVSCIVYTHIDVLYVLARPISWAVKKSLDPFTIVFQLWYCQLSNAKPHEFGTWSIEQDLTHSDWLVIESYDHRIHNELVNNE